jgi:hypothetical protein
LSACAGFHAQTLPQRNIASFSGGSPTEVVDAVIAKLGPVRSQGNTQLCFAHAAADVATFYTGRRVSAFSVAVRNFQKREGFDYALFNPLGSIAGKTTQASKYMLGLASSVLTTSLGSTLCPDDQENRPTYRDGDLKSLWESYDRFRVYIGPKKPVELYERIAAGLSQVMPSLDSSTFSPNRYRTLDQALGEWFDQRCRLQLPEMKVTGVRTGAAGADSILKAINDALASGTIAMIHYDPAVLDSIDPSVFQFLVGFHVSTIVAKARIEGETHYLLRNSWSEACHYYSKDISRRCDRGHIWLTENEVRKYVTSVAYYQ